MSKHAFTLANFRHYSPTSLPATATGVFLFWPALPIFNFNGLLHCVCADRAPTYPQADRRKTKPSDREAGVQLGDHDPPTPKGQGRTFGESMR
jgi:hypothetical protein